MWVQYNANIKYFDWWWRCTLAPPEASGLGVKNVFLLRFYYKYTVYIMYGRINAIVVFSLRHIRR